MFCVSRMKAEIMFHEGDFEHALIIYKSKGSLKIKCRYMYFFL